MNDLVYKFGWPTLEACQDLGLPVDYQYMFTGTYNASIITTGTSDVQVQEGTQESAETLYLLVRIYVLEAQAQRSNQAKTTANSVEAKGQQVKKLNPVVLERRRRHKFITLEKTYLTRGTATAEFP